MINHHLPVSVDNEMRSIDIEVNVCAILSGTCYVCYPFFPVMDVMDASDHKYLQFP